MHVLFKKVIMYSDDRLNDIYGKTNGRCHICRTKLKWKHYGISGSWGGWEVDHSNPKANGGSERMSNLYPACIPCKRAKSTRSQRRLYGYQSAPESREERVERWYNLFLIGVISLFTYVFVASNQQKQETPELWNN